jgi:RND family efflux transporter MFP subunit
MSTCSTLRVFLWGTLLAPLWLSTACAAEQGLSLTVAQARAAGVRTERVSGQTQTLGTRYPAVITLPPAQQQVVASPLTGLIRELRVQPGDSVRAGDVVAVLSSPQALEMRREMLSAESQHVLAVSARARDEALFAEGLIARGRLEATTAHARQAALQADERRHALADSGASLAEGGTEPSQLTLRAAVSGGVLERLATVGPRVDGSVALLRIGQLSPLWVELQLPAREASAVRVGDRVAVAGSAATGQVIAVAPAVDAAAQSVLVRAVLRQGLAGLRVGQAVEASLERAAPGVRKLTQAAVYMEGGRAQVMVEVAQGRYVAQPVQVVGQMDGQLAVQGLAADSRVVVKGLATLRSARAAASQ